MRREDKETTKGHRRLQDLAISLNCGGEAHKIELRGSGELILHDHDMADVRERIHQVEILQAMSNDGAKSTSSSETHCVVLAELCTCHKFYYAWTNRVSADYKQKNRTRTDSYPRLGAYKSFGVYDESHRARNRISCVFHALQNVGKDRERQIEQKGALYRMSVRRSRGMFRDERLFRRLNLQTERSVALRPSVGPLDQFIQVTWSNAKYDPDYGLHVGCTLPLSSAIPTKLTLSLGALWVWETTARKVSMINYTVQFMLSVKRERKNAAIRAVLIAYADNPHQTNGNHGRRKELHDRLLFWYRANTTRMDYYNATAEDTLYARSTTLKKQKYINKERHRRRDKNAQLPNSRTTGSQTISKRWNR